MKIDAINSIKSFKSLGRESLEALNKVAKIKVVDKDSILYYEGEKIECAYFLVDGLLELYKMDQNNNELFLCYVSSEEDARLINCFGNFEPYIASASVHSLRTSTILLLELHLLADLVSEYLDISNALLREFMGKNIVFKNFINFKEIYDSTARVAYILRTQLDYFNKVQRQTIARELNIKIETLSRILQKMFQQGLIYKNNKGEICLSNKAEFERIYGG
ncbi:Crp/Fnr family transcriptional regulator [Helicobacter sp. MIT 05-5293]|uniref:Crp/Fnr family transcriptional regulator n=1 Tax=Helicobacter sp. MIT 05-5293 TaxID=1548149 RepID=UPI00051DE014|nr:Crp/Fnr family transcriptional regulator [Helicobacter sp. MIT 05-5293]TLD81887.1 Crp/Fnr family transcriptional regulator [Helicobacter sp. MIT 05-5293]